MYGKKICLPRPDIDEGRDIPGRKSPRRWGHSSARRSDAGTSRWPAVWVRLVKKHNNYFMKFSAHSYCMHEYAHVWQMISMYGYMYVCVCTDRIKYLTSTSWAPEVRPQRAAGSGPSNRPVSLIKDNNGQAWKIYLHTPMPTTVCMQL